MAQVRSVFPPTGSVFSPAMPFPARNQLAFIKKR
jgi:hypothetical protein